MPTDPCPPRMVSTSVNGNVRTVIAFPSSSSCVSCEPQPRLTSRPRSGGLRDPQEFGGHLVVLHDFAAFPVGLKRSHSQSLELRAIGIIHLEVQRIIGNECEKQLAGIDADSAEHRARAKLRHNTTQLVDDECAEARHALSTLQGALQID